MSLFEKIKNIFTIKPINPAPTVDVVNPKKEKVTTAKTLDVGKEIAPKTKNKEVTVAKEPTSEYNVKQPKNKSKKGK